VRSLISIRQFREEDMDALVREAQADNHSVVAPTYLISKEGETVGYIGVIPTIAPWMHTKKTNVRDSILMMNTFENVLRCQSAQIVGVACVNQSPYFKYMPEAGYVNTQSTLFLKNLNP
jgi:hypothetical protein